MSWFGTKCVKVLIINVVLNKRKENLFVGVIFMYHHVRKSLLLSHPIQYFGGGSFRLSRNALYIVVFKNPRDQLGVRNVLFQSFPTTWKEGLDPFHQTTARPFGYLVMASSDERRLLSRLLKHERWSRCYQKRVDPVPDGIPRKKETFTWFTPRIF